uniref:Uncharacterized protein n=1 Tax=Anopheles christyi TaxID=43041 RepID=A0A182KH95_9DIPT
MEKNAAPTAAPSCNIDKRPPNQTYITAWRNKREFQSVYGKIFNSPPDDIETKEDGLRWLKMWRARQMKDFPICVRCTFQILEAQVFDLRSQQAEGEGASSKAMEIKNIYAGAFTRFINFLTENGGGGGGGVGGGGGTRKKSIAESVREIGIETYLVELRHLCAHRSVTISIDVFRRSAQYCMDWLNKAYWQRELAGMQPVSYDTLKYSYAVDTQLPDMSTILRTYDAVAAARVRHAYNVEMVIDGVGLVEEEIELVKMHAEKHGSPRLPVITRQIVGMLQELKLPPSQAAVNAVCKAVFDNCKRMFEDAVRFGDDDKVPLGMAHTELFRALTAMGCVQTFFEQLMVICEQDNVDGDHVDDDRRSSAVYWAHQIAFGFQLLKEFKKACRTWRPDQVDRFGFPPRHEMAKEWYAKRLKSASDQQLILGLAVDCPWHMKLSRAYVLARLTAMNEHTKDIVPILLSLLEPPLSPLEQQKINKLTQVYNGNKFSTIKQANGNVAPNTEDMDGANIFTADDLLEVVAKKRANSKPMEMGESLSKKVQRIGPWTERDVEIDWSCYPLGTCPT